MYVYIYIYIYRIPDYKKFPISKKNFLDIVNLLNTYALFKKFVQMYKDKV